MPPQSVLLALAAGCCFAFLALAYKLAERWQCRALSFTFVFTLVAAGFALVRVCSAPANWASPTLWLLGAAMGILLTGAIVLVNLANRQGPAYITWTVLNLSLLVPILFAALLRQETLVLTDILILALFTLMLLFFNRGMKRLSPERNHGFWRYALLLFGCWLTNGLFLYGNKLKYLCLGEGFSAELAVVFYLTGAAAVCLLAGVSRRAFWPKRREWLAGTAAGICSAVGVLLMLAAMSLPSAAVFPLIQGTSLIGGTLFTGLVFRESFNRWMVVGMSCGLVVLLLAIYRDSFVF